MQNLTNDEINRLYIKIQIDKLYESLEQEAQKNKRGVLIFGKHTTPNLSEEDIEKILLHMKQLERDNYPRHFQFGQHVESLDDIADYADCSLDELFIYYGFSFYIICTIKRDYIEVVDLCGKLTPSVINAFQLIIKYDNNKNRPIIFDARITSDTNRVGSYELALKYLTKNGYEILEDKQGGDDLIEDSMHHVVAVKKHLPMNTKQKILNYIRDME